jgi:hypothetical protein
MLNKQKSKKIIFTKNDTNVSDEYAPKPSIYFIPEWYKKMEPSYPEKKKFGIMVTIKKCIPVLDSITAGYIIVSPCDVYITIVDDEVQYKPVLNGIMDFHPRKQAHLHPKANEFMFPKWVNPWAIRTPRGYSCLFKPPAHNPNPWFEILEGIVDTDNYNAPVHFPFVLKDTTKEYIIPAGTPIAQVIPFKRESWKYSLSDDRTFIDKTISFLTSKFFDRYKHMFWSRKNYS